MENITPSQAHAQVQAQNASPDSTTHGRKRSGSGGSILSKFPFLRTSDSKSNLNEARTHGVDNSSSSSPRQHGASSSSTHSPPPRALSAISQQQKTRKRKGSLRKVALLGRGAARGDNTRRGELRPLAIDTTTAATTAQTALGDQRQLPASAPILNGTGTGTGTAGLAAADDEEDGGGGGSGFLGLGISDAMTTPRPSMDGYAAARQGEKMAGPPRVVSAAPDAAAAAAAAESSQVTSPTISYTSTTDEEDGPSAIPGVHLPSPLRPEQRSSGSDAASYYSPNRSGGAAGGSSTTTSLQRRRSVKHSKSPLSLQGLTASPLPTSAEEPHDYGETAWWGWMILVVTWFVFIIGIGSCFNIWSWAWDVGTTPYAPPEFEDDPTLPIVGYYPALIILTCIMAWVWVVVAWIGMKYFRHAKISGD